MEYLDKSTFDRRAFFSPMNWSTVHVVFYIIETGEIK